MKKVFLRIHNAFYLLFVFGAFFWLFPWYWVVLRFKGKRAHDFAHFLNTVWAWCFTIPGFTWVRGQGKEKLDRKQPYVFASNHTSYLDIPACNIAIPHSFRYLGKKELGKIPMFGYMYRRLHILVDRKSRIDKARALIRTKQKLEEGTSVLYFPEGTIIKDPNLILANFKDGAFRLAIDAKVPIVPVTIMGAREALPDDKKWLLHPRPIKVVMDEPISTEGMTVEDVPVLREQVREVILERLKTYYAGIESGRKKNLKPGKEN